jgi:hypothetical protein
MSAFAGCSLSAKFSVRETKKTRFSLAGEEKPATSASPLCLALSGTLKFSVAT